ncbi:hypothetical protein N431DRAFT_400316 [Stipitochalara longipes BDJ]|nr:hypothetical protein N431DRAFT_400316 [Stipitochalara longipes BDJ]
MLVNILLVALAASPLVAAHGKVAVVTGDAGGNTTALGIQGGVVPGAGSNSKTEVDTTIFNSVKAATNGLGRTEGKGQNTLSGMSAVVAQSGSTLPQVSSSGGTLSGTLHVVTTDGAGPFKAIVDPTGTGQFASGTEADVTTQVPGKNGNILPDGQVARAVSRVFARMGLHKRAANVNKDYPFTVAIPAGTTCTGTAGGQSGVCLVKFANSNPAGPFGGVFAMQIAGSNSTA